MIERILGRSGIRVSAIALGCEGFAGKSLKETKEMMDFAIAEGINFLDLYSPDPQLRSAIGAALRVWVNGCVAAAVNLFYRHIYVRFGRRDSISGPERSGK